MKIDGGDVAMIVLLIYVPLGVLYLKGWWENRLKRKGYWL